MNTQELLRIGLPALILSLIAAAAAILSVPLLESGENLAAVSSSEVVALTNEEREDKGIAMLKRNALLDQAAQMKAQDMAAKAYYAHISPEGLTPMHWVDAAGYRYLIIGENLVVNRTDAEQVVDAFMGSPGHKANILRKDFTEIGVGVASGVYKGKDATFTVQIFAAPYPHAATAVAKASGENVKPTSVPSKPAGTPAPEVPSVPRATAVPARETPVTASSVADNANALQEKVKEAIRPLLPPVSGASVPAGAATSSVAFEAPPFVLNSSVPVEIGDVSQLEEELLPAPLGSTWTMEFRAFVENVLLSARGLFVR